MTNNDVIIEVTCISCGLGESCDWVYVPGISDDDAKILNDIGNGSNKNYESTEEYLNIIDNGYAYKVYHLKTFLDTYEDEYLIISVKEKTPTLFKSISN